MTLIECKCSIAITISLLIGLFFEGFHRVFFLSIYTIVFETLARFSIETKSLIIAQKLTNFSSLYVPLELSLEVEIFAKLF